jgi:serine/threonine-protein kinase HipA
MSSLDYGHLMDASFQLERNAQAYNAIFRLCAFNLYIHNRDDHSKNFSFLMNEKGIWRFAPVYDLTFSTSSFGSHCTSIAGEYKNSTETHLLELAKTFGIKKPKLLLDEVKQAVSNWEQTAKLCAVSKDSVQLFGKTSAGLLRG